MGLPLKILTSSRKSLATPRLANQRVLRFHNDKICSADSIFVTCLCAQEAQLSQRDRATLRVIEYLPKSLRIIRNDTV